MNRNEQKLTENFLAVGFGPASLFHFLADFPCWRDNGRAGAITGTHVHAFLGDAIPFEVVFAHPLHSDGNLGPIDGVDVT